MLIKVDKAHTLTGHRDCVYTVIQADDTTVISAAGDGMIVSWDLCNPEEGELIAKLPNSVYAIHAISNTNWLIVGHNYEGLHLIDWVSRKETASIKLTSSQIFDIKTFENFLLVANGDGSLVIVDLKTWTVFKRFNYSNKSARTIAINSAKGEFAVGYSDNFIRVFSIQNFELIQEFEAHGNSVFALHYTQDFEFLISGSRDARVKVWSAENNYNKVNEVVAHMYAINSMAFSPDKQLFATASMDKSIKIWDVKEFRLLKVIDKARHAGHATSVNKLVWTTFKNQIVSASDDRTLSVWNIASLPENS